MEIHDLIKNPDLMKETDMNEILTMIRNGLENGVDMKEISNLMKQNIMQRYVQFMLAKKMKNERVDGPDKENL